MGTKGKDAFSGLIANISGVDTSGFIKRTLNELKTEHTTTSTPKQQSQTPATKTMTSTKFENILNSTEKQTSLPLSFDKNTFKNEKGPVITGLDDLLGIDPEIPKNTEKCNVRNSQPEFEELFADVTSSEKPATLISLPSFDSYLSPNEILTQQQYSARKGSPIIEETPEFEDGFKFNNNSNDDKNSQKRVCIGETVSISVEEKEEEIEIEEKKLNYKKLHKKNQSYSNLLESEDEEEIEESKRNEDKFEKIYKNKIESNEFSENSLNQNYQENKKSDIIENYKYERSSSEEGSIGKYKEDNEKSKSKLDPFGWAKKDDQIGKRMKGISDKFGKLQSNFNKRAMEMKKKSVMAVQKGIEAAQDWMDKRLEFDKKKSVMGQQQQYGNNTPPNINSSCEDEIVAIEIAAEIVKLQSHEQAMALKMLHPKMKKQVEDLIMSQGAIARPDDTAVMGQDIENEVDNINVNSKETIISERANINNYNANEFKPMSNSDGWVESGSISETLSSSLPTNAPKDNSEINHTEADLLGLGNQDEDAESNSSMQGKSESEYTVPISADPDDLDTFFQGGSGVDGIACSNSSGDSPLKSQQPTSNINIKSDVMKYNNVNNEVLDRETLIENRIKLKNEKIAAALDQKLQRDQDEEEKRNKMSELREELWPKINQWKEKHRGNIRGLLTTLESVLWEGTTWKPLGVGDVLETSQVKKAYMKANLVVHPDKVRQKNGPLEQVVVADMIFDVLKEAWSKFTV